MKTPWARRIVDSGRLLHLSARMIAGRRYWLVPLFPLVWIGLQLLFLVAEFRQEAFVPADAQTVLIGLPLMVLGIGLGVRIIAGEIDRRTLEITYTVPGGTQRVWIFKLLAALLLLLPAEALLTLATWLFCTDFPASALYGALQAAAFYMVLAMALSALFRSEAAGALVTIVVAVVNIPFQGANARVSPFWNPEKLAEFEPATVLAWTVQNRVGFLLAIAAVIALAFGRAEQRERILGG